MKRFYLTVFLLSVLSFKGWTSTTWPTDNEQLYKQMLEYVTSVSGTISFEPVYCRLQQFRIEAEAAHRSDKYAWIGQTLRLCTVLETIYPPFLEHNAVMAEDRYQKLRRLIVELKDYPLHVHTIRDASDAGGAAPPAEQVAAFHTYNRQSLDIKRNGALDYLKTVPRPSDGSIQVIKFYSSGYVFRTANACIGLDICYAEGMYSTDRRSELAGYLDAMFITHAHGDHYDIPLMTEMLKAGRPVVMTNDIPKDAPSEHKIIWDRDVTSPVPIVPGVSAQAGMAAQGNVPCLLFLIDCDGWKIAATGDNSQIDKEVFYHGRPVPDIVVTPIFQGIPALNGHLHQATNEEGITPVYFSAHESEWHHTLDGRIPYSTLYRSVYSSLKSDAMYTVVMDQGEHVILEK